MAPDRERTAASHSLTLHKPLRVHSLGARTFSVSGTPTDCVNLAVNTILSKRPDLVVSGINRGANLGDDVTYSGTVAAAMEGTLLGISSIAVSLCGEDPFNFEAAARFLIPIVRWVSRSGLPPDTLLNVNVPNLPSKKITGVKVTCLGKRVFASDSIVEKRDPRGKTYYWMGGNRVNWEARKNTDQEAVESGSISVTPVHLDLTNYAALAEIRGLERRATPPRKRKD